MATAFSSPDQIVEAAPIADNAQSNLEQEQLEEVFEIGRCEAWVKTNGYSRLGTSYLSLNDILRHTKMWIQACGEITIGDWTTKRIQMAVCE